MRCSADLPNGSTPFLLHAFISAVTAKDATFNRVKASGSIRTFLNYAFSLTADIAASITSGSVRRLPLQPKAVEAIFVSKENKN